MKKNGFTLIELLAVVVVLTIILAIAVPSVTDVISNSTKASFESDAKMVLKAVGYKKLENSDFNEATVTKNNIADLLGISDQNYDNVSISMENGVATVLLKGAGKWKGLIACGTFQNMRVVTSTTDCSSDVTPPIITILGDNIVNINAGDIYIDAGATATDDVDGNITSRIVVISNLNVNIPGSYIITYNVDDKSGNSVSATRTVNVIDNVAPTITFGPNGNSAWTKTTSTSVTVNDAGIVDVNSLRYQWTTSATAPTEDNFITTFTNGGTINTPLDVTGGYYLWILAKDTTGNTAIVGSNVFNLDNTPPVITLNGSNSININVGSAYTDAGATATDNIDGDITENISIISNVNVNIIGTYTITYNVSDNVGNVANQVTRIVNVIDVSAPVIVLNGSNPVNINVGSTYTDAGATATDDVDGDVTSKIVSTGTVNVNVPGAYTITYTVKDNANNTAVATRTVNVIDNVAPTVVFGTNGNATWAKNHNTTVTVNDNVSVNTSSLKYQWTTSTTAPAEASFTTSFANGGTISTPAGVTGGYYLWILAKDSATIPNTIITKSNIFNLDNTPPVITLSGSNPVNINVGEAYTDAGATATDANSGINGSVAMTGSVNTANPGTYVLTYNVSDKAGNAATAVTRTVNVNTVSYTYNYTGGAQTLVVPLTGNYKLEVWGAQGGAYGGSGGYSVGTKTLTAGQTVYIYVGGAGGNSTAVGYNGGGKGTTSTLTMAGYTWYCGAGGGATDIRIGGTALTNRIIVAGGGSGAGMMSYNNGTGIGAYLGADGGGTVGGDRVCHDSSCTIGGGTQTAGGVPKINGVTQSGSGSLGLGGDSTNGSGGGGGYYGGAGGLRETYSSNGTNVAYLPGGGGSGYVGGVTNGSMQSGVQAGNGTAKITYIGQ